MEEAVQLGLVGCGLMGRRHIYGIKEIQDRGFQSARLEAVCDVVRDRAQSLADLAADTLGATPSVYTNLADMVENERNLDAVDIVTNPRSHHVLAEEAFRAGKHVIVEKPMAITVKACHNMMRASDRYGLTLAVAENYRRDPLNRLVGAAVQKEVVGEPYLVLQHSVGGGGAIAVSRWRHIKEQGGILVDMGVHYTDILRYFLGDVEEVYGRIAIFEKMRIGEAGQGEGDIVEKVEPNVEDTAVAIMKFRNGVLGQWIMSYSGYGKRTWQRLIYGSKGCIDAPPDRTGRPPMVTLDGGEQISGEDLLRDLDVFSTDDVTPRFFPEGLSQYNLKFQDIDRRLIAVEICDFATSLIKGRRPEVDGLQGMKAVALAYAICESAHINQPVKVKDVEDGRIDGYQYEINGSLNL